MTIIRLWKRKTEMERLPVKFYRVQCLYLFVAAAPASFYLYMAHLFAENTISESFLSLTLSLASVASFIQLLLNSLIDLSGKEKFFSISFPVAAALMIFGVAVMGHGVWPMGQSPGLLTMTACWLAASGVFAEMASTTLVPQLVADDRAKTAFSQKTAIFSLEAVIGPMLGGFVISVFGGQFFLSFIGAILSLITLIFIREKFAFSNGTPQIGEKSVNGFKLVFKIKTELCISIISAVFNFVFSPFLVLILPVLIMGHYKMTAFQVGLLRAIFAAGVLLGGAFVVERVNALIGIRNAVALGGALIAVSILAHAMTPTPFFALYGLYQLVAGIGLALFNVNVTTIRCLATPSAYRIKMESAFLLICMSSIPAGMGPS